MIAWSIEAASSCAMFDHVIVSTDDDEIAQIAQAHGAKAPFRRPTELADDYTATRPVVNHAIRKVEQLFGLPDYVCVIYPTAPFIVLNDLKKGLELMISTSTDFAFTVTTFASPIQRALRLTSDGYISMFQPEYRNTRSQDIEPAYHDAGQFYWGRTKAFLENLPTFDARSVPIILPRYRVHDIDTEEDWVQAELMFAALRANPVTELHAT